MPETETIVINTGPLIALIAGYGDLSFLPGPLLLGPGPYTLSPRSLTGIRLKQSSSIRHLVIYLLQRK